MFNIFEKFKQLLPEDPLLVGEVVSMIGSQVEIKLPDDTKLLAKSLISLTPGQKVFVRANTVEGIAPNLPIVLIEV